MTRVLKALGLYAAGLVLVAHSVNGQGKRELSVRHCNNSRHCCREVMGIWTIDYTCNLVRVQSLPSEWVYHGVVSYIYIYIHCV